MSAANFGHVSGRQEYEHRGFDQNGRPRPKLAIYHGYGPERIEVVEFPEGAPGAKYYVYSTSRYWHTFCSTRAFAEAIGKAEADVRSTVTCKWGVGSNSPPSAKKVSKLDQPVDWSDPLWAMLGISTLAGIVLILLSVIGVIRPS